MQHHIFLAMMMMIKLAMAMLSTEMRVSTGAVGLCRESGRSVARFALLSQLVEQMHCHKNVCCVASRTALERSRAALCASEWIRITIDIW